MDILTAKNNQQLIKDNPQNHDSNSKGETTTISTIAVRAEPHSTLVVALLKSINYVDFRIDEMHPGLLEIGANPQENSQLLLIHTDLFQRLQEKHQQVDDLLARAEQIASEQTEVSDVIVYEAMANGLATAWRGLSRQLEMRGYILSDTKRLYELALKQEELSKLLGSRLQSTNSNAKLGELTCEGMNVGSNLITQIRLLGSLSDNDQRPRETFEACLRIEKVMLKMAESWELLNEACRNLKNMSEQPQQLPSHITQTIESKQIQQQITESFDIEIQKTQLDNAEQWLYETRRMLENMEESKILKTLEEQTKEKLEELRTFSKNTIDYSEFENRNNKLQQLYIQLINDINIKIELLEKTENWYLNADNLICQLGKMLEELNNANESMSAELGPLAQQKGVVLVDQGEQLILQWKGENKEENLINQNICERIAQKVQILKEAVIAVVQLASEKIGASKTQKIVEKLNILDKWLNTVADPFLSESVVLSPVATETTEFIAKHKKVLAEITENENLLKSVQNHQKLLDPTQLDLSLNIQRRMISYKSVIEKRINLATKLEQLQKLGRELETSLHFLATLLQGGGYRLETEQHVNNLLQTVKEHCIREKQQTDTFQQMASDLIPNDSNLITIEALHWSHSQGVSHQRQFALLEQQCHQFMNFKEIQQENSFKNQKIQQPSIKTIQENKQKIIEELGEYNREINLEQKMNFENGDSHGPNVPPSIGPPLCSQLVREGQTVVLKTRVRGTPSPKVHWFYNDCPIDFERSDIGLSLHQDGQCILTIPCVLVEHAGQYSIKAENLGGRATSTATLNVLLGIGSPAAPPGQFQFPSSMKNKMEEQKQQQYYIENNYNNFQQTKHQGPVYALIKSEGSESRRASDGDIMDPGYSSLANPPECFRPFPSEVTINEGEKAEVDCMILGNPRPKVQWFFNGRQIKSNAEFVELSNIGDTYSIRFNSARLECAGWYRLIADNIRGRCESLTLIHIRPKSLIPKPIGNNQRARRSIGGVQGLLQWQKQRQQLLQQQQARALSTPPRRDFEGKRHSTSSAHAEMIGIMSTSDYEPDRRESGLEIFVNGYTGNEASEFNNYPEINRTPSSDQEPTLILSPKIIYQNNSDVEPPHFTKTLVSAIVNEGQNVKFEAVVTGIPIPNLVWSKDGNLLKSDGHNSIYLDNYGKTILSINNININDAGKYCCTAENNAGKACSSAQLVLSAKMIAPDFVERLVSQEVEIDSSLIWTVRTSGDPEPLVKWFRDGNIISTDFSIKNSIQTTKDAPFVYSLRIEFLKMEHAGQYTCLLENVAGEARSTADLVVRPKGAPPGKYVHVTKVTQERQESQLAKNEIVILKNKEDNNL